MREKLIELENDARMNAHWHGAKNQIEYVVDYLIANGVTIPVRCKDCKYRRGDFFGGFVCRLHKGLAMVTDESFCSYGERRTDV
jgi:hypothetical protein